MINLKKVCQFIWLLFICRGLFTKFIKITFWYRMDQMLSESCHHVTIPGAWRLSSFNDNIFVLLSNLGMCSGFPSAAMLPLTSITTTNLEEFKMLFQMKGFCHLVENRQKSLDYEFIHYLMQLLWIFFRHWTNLAGEGFKRINSGSVEFTSADIWC